MADSSRRWGALGTVVVIAGAAALWLALGRSGEESTPRPREPAAPPVAEDASPERADAGSAGGDQALAAGGRLKVALADLTPGEPYVLLLEVPRPADGSEVAGAVISLNGRVDIEATFDDEDAAVGRVEIPGDALAKPGRYMVELRSKESSPLRLRRYVLEVE